MTPLEQKIATASLQSAPVVDYLSMAPGLQIVMTTLIPNAESKFVILQGLAEGNRFWSNWKPGDDATKLGDGTVAYRVLGYTSTAEEAQTFLYGRSYT